MGMAESIRYFRFQSLYTPAGWRTPAYVGVDATGIIRYLDSRIPDGVALEPVAGFALPGFINGHSHAFQYAMAGRAEQHPTGIRDDFWTWREAMYQCAHSVDPDQLQVIATLLYIEMLRQGYTHVAEFHYLHHDKNGQPYSQLAEMGGRLAAAAHAAGIRLTLIPVFYQQANFGVPLHDRQRRFFSANTSDYLKLLDASREAIQRFPGTRLGASVHSLRAVSGEAVLEAIRATPYELPFHLHVAEQVKEVEDCVAHYARRPLQWLLHHNVLNERFFLVHGTHLDDAEITQLPGTGATVVVCPSTEGNLGDGFFRMAEYVSKCGRWCIGTDSHVGLSPLEELRMIDYRQRLLLRLRNPLGAHPAKELVEASVCHGLRSVGRSPSFLQPGDPLDAVVYAAADPLLEASDDAARLATLVYTHSSPPIGTLVAGQWQVHAGHHRLLPAARAAFTEVVRAIFSSH
jgi:formimidoylglutamate deiminase